MTAIRRFFVVLFCLALLPANMAIAQCELNYDPIPKPPQDYGDHSVAGCAQKATGRSYQSYEYTSKIVHCIEGTIRGATYRIMSFFSAYFAGPTAILCTLVVIFYGIRVAMGERELLKLTMTLAIKFAFVGVFINNLPTVVTWVFGTLSDILTMVTGGVTPWTMIDNFLGNLLGFGPSFALMNGLLGLIGAAVFSSSVGMLMFFTGIMAVLNVLTFIMGIVFDYLLAYLAIGFLLVFAPVMIPMSLFSQTDRYFRKWADIIVGVIITPVLMFAFLWMFIGIFDILIENIFSILGGHDFKAYWRNNQPLFSWLMPSDPNATRTIQNIPAYDDLCGVTGVENNQAMRPPTQLTSNPFAKGQVDAGAGKVATLDFGANDVNIVTQLSVALTALWIFSACMKSMMAIIPQVAKGIASVTGIDSGGGSALVGKLQGAINSTQDKLSSNVAADKAKYDKVSNYVTQISKMMKKRK